MAKSDNKPSKKKSKKNKNIGPKAVAMKNKASKADNPFETIWSRRKFDILGKKRKGEEVRMGLSRSLAIQKRNKTLLKEYEQSGKSSVFVDKRIGERDDALGDYLSNHRGKTILTYILLLKICSPLYMPLLNCSYHSVYLFFVFEDKIEQESQYNLSDGEDDEFEIPGVGERDDFEDGMLSDDDNDDWIDADKTGERSNVLKEFHADYVQNSVKSDLIGGEEKKHKSKKEIMEEVTLKSKYFKAQKAKDKEENEQFMEELDKTFSSLVQSRVVNVND